MTANRHAPADTLSPAQKRRAFYAHLLRYVLVMVALAAFNLLKQPDKLWFIWPALGWGLGVAWHALRVFRQPIMPKVRGSQSDMVGQ